MSDQDLNAIAEQIASEQEHKARVAQEIAEMAGIVQPIKVYEVTLQTMCEVMGLKRAATDNRLQKLVDDGKLGSRIARVETEAGCRNKKVYWCIGDEDKEASSLLG